MPSRTARRNNSLSGSIPIITTFRVGSALRRGGMIEHSPRVLWGGSNNSTWGDAAVIFNTTPDDRGAEPTTLISVFLLRILANASRSSRFSARRKTEIFPTIVVIYRLNLRSFGGSWFDPFQFAIHSILALHWSCYLLSLYTLCYACHVSRHGDCSQWGHCSRTEMRWPGRKLELLSAIRRQATRRAVRASNKTWFS